MTTPVVTIVNGTGYTWGIPTPEVGINIESFKLSIKPQWWEMLPNNVNINTVISAGPMVLGLVMSGEINATTGIMALAIATAYAVANSTAYFGAPTTGLYFKGGEISKTRSTWMKLDSAEFEANANIP